MKTQFPLLLCWLLLAPLGILQAQTTKGFSYQAVARNSNGSPIANTAVNLRFQIRENTASGPIMYQETFSPSTNDYGLFNAIIGNGNVELGVFESIEWGSKDYFLVVELNGATVDASLLQSVPYAKIATDMSISSLTDVSITAPTSGQVLKWNGSEWAPGSDDGGNSYVAGTGISITGSTINNTAPDQPVSLTGSGATSISGSYPNFTITSTDNVNDADASPTNELQTLSVSGSNLSISGGNSVALPAASYVAGTGISITGSTINNTAPNQPVSLTGSGATSISGSYPNFTITSTDNVNDADASPTNELQTLSLSGNTLSLSNSGGNVNLASFASPWSTSGSNLFYNSGNIGIGDNSPIATLTVGNGDKLQINGADGDIVFSDDQGSLRFANSSGANAPMMQMFQSGTNNSTRMLLAHSPSFPTWGIRYNDTADAFTWIGDNIPVFQVQLAGQQRVGVGTESPEAKFHVSTNSATGFGQLKLTETQFDYARITMNNNVHSNYWDIAARTDTNLANATLNFFHSNAGDIFSVNAQGRIGVNDATPSYTMEINGNGNTRIINAYNDLPATTNTTYNYGLRIGLSQAANTGFPRLY
ncbi:MAG: hypothetical protein NWR72_20580, partial [Bacteroidia bacterium]|nr:hypothetical protein [Bacteroidia bacterium]